MEVRINEIDSRAYGMGRTGVLQQGKREEGKQGNVEG